MPAGLSQQLSPLCRFLLAAELAPALLLGLPRLSQYAPLTVQFTVATALHVELLLALLLGQFLLKPLSFTLLPTIHLPPVGEEQR